MIPIASPVIGDEECEAVVDVLQSGELAAGSVVSEFEAEFADLCGVEHAVAVANGTAALETALRALGIGGGDRVVTSPFTFVATANAIRLVGAEPVFVDVVPETYNLDPMAVERLLEDEGDDVDAILVPHLYGLPADLGHLHDLADEYDLALIEDAAQAHGASFRGHDVGSIGDAGCFSFYPTKNMTTGEGGMVTTDDPDVAERVRRYVNHGRTDRYRHVEVAHNLRTTNVAAAIGRVQLSRLPGFNERRRSNAAYYTDRLRDLPVRAPYEPNDRTHVYHQYTIRANDRDDLAAHLDAEGVETGVYYDTPVHEQPAYADVDVSCPVAELAADQVLSLPVHPGVTDRERERVVDAIGRFYDER